MSEFDTEFTLKIRLDIAGHASPRWKSASRSDDADQSNLELSQRRAENVAVLIENMFLSELPDRKIVFERNLSASPVGTSRRDGPHTINSIAHGNTKTLKEVGQDRSSDDKAQRRVEIAAGFEYMVYGQAPSIHPYTVEISQLTRYWAIRFGTTASATAGLSASYSTLKLKNVGTGLVANCEITSGGGGSLGLGAVESLGDSYSYFTVREPMKHSEFNNVWIRVESASVGLLIGYSWTKVNFLGLGKDAQLVDTSGWEAGAMGKLGGSVRSGRLKVKTPPNQYKTVSVVEWEDYRYKKARDHGTVVNFDTGEDIPDSFEKGLLRKWVREISSDLFQPN